MTTRIESLDTKIAELKLQQQENVLAVHHQLQITMATLSPAKYLKNTFQDLISIPDISENIVDSAIGIATGYISKKIIIGNTHHPIKKLLGSAIQLLLTNYVSKHPNAIKYGIEMLIEKIITPNQITPNPITK
jgi:hypothetical protein